MASTRGLSVGLSWQADTRRGAASQPGNPPWPALAGAIHVFWRANRRKRRQIRAARGTRPTLGYNSNRRRHCRNPAEIYLIQIGRIINDRIEDAPGFDFVFSRARDAAAHSYRSRTVGGVAADTGPGPGTAERTRQAQRNQAVLRRDRSRRAGRDAPRRLGQFRLSRQPGSGALQLSCWTAADMGAARATTSRSATT